MKGKESPSAVKMTAIMKQKYAIMERLDFLCNAEKAFIDNTNNTTTVSYTYSMINQA